MVDRIKSVMDFKQLTKSSFARAIGIDPSRMTHIFNGHNEPTLDMVRRIVLAFPDVSSEWLISGIGNMLKEESVNSKMQSEPEPTIRTVDNMQQTSLFDFDEPEVSETEGSYEEKAANVEEEELADESVTIPQKEVVVSKTAVASASVVENLPTVKSQSSQSRNRVKMQESHNSGGYSKKDRISNSQQDKKIVKIVFFYEDHSFEEYRPN